ncbi:MAG: QbdB [Sulfurovum sp.]|nr:MAG: QbdB [Sulfurovum sp.]
MKSKNILRVKEEPTMTKNIHLTYLLCLVFVMHSSIFAQDLEPRRWTALPSGTTILGIGLGHNASSLNFDPLLEIDDADVKRDFLILNVTHFFSLAGKSLRFDALLPFHNAKWDGLLRGEPADVQRTGLADPRFRLSINLLGAPDPGSGSKKPANTVVGAAISVNVPWGENHEDKLLNLGNNRYTIRPQIGVVHTRGPWSYELTGSVFFFTDNNDFFNGNKMEQDPFYAVQTHIIRVFSPGVWASLGAGYEEGSRSTVNGKKNDDNRDGFIAALSAGVPITANQGVKLSYIWSEINTSTAKIVHSDTVVLAWSIRF